MTKILLFSFFIILFSTNKIKASPKEYTVGVESIPFMPYSDVKEGKYLGVLRDILEAFAKEEGIILKYIPLPINRLYVDFYNNKIDLKIPSNPYWQKDIKERKRLKVIYSEPIVEYIDGLMLKNKETQIDKIKVLGVVAGFTPWEYLGKIEKKLILKKENPSIQGLLEQGILNRIDALYINIAVGNHYLAKDLKKSDSLAFGEKLPHTRSAYHLASIKYPDVIKRFNSFLKTNPKVLVNIRKHISQKLK